MSNEKMNSLNVVAYGGGTNSTANIIGMFEKNIPIDLILFADTGGERPETYEYVRLFSEWCVNHGLPPITIVKKVRANGEVLTLEQDCLEKNMLPSIAYGFKSCSGKYKIQPQDKFVNNWEPARKLWAEGMKVTKFIGYDANEERRAKIFDDEKYEYRYLLIEWGWDRDTCIEKIKEHGLPLPGKSACFFCPSSKKLEIIALPPDLQERAIKIEECAEEAPRKCAHCSGAGKIHVTEKFIEDSNSETFELQRYDENVTVMVIGKKVACDEWQKCPACGGSGELEKIIKGLGRDFAWRDLIRFDKAQIQLFPDSLIDIDCGCYDG